jgi:hypothetical protein
MGGKVKLGSGKNMGYIGYHQTWDNKKVFLRSKAEFIVAKMLDIEKTPYLTEYKDYRINNIGYRPDFFIFDNTQYSNIIEIIEVKGQDNKREALIYKELFGHYFEDMSINYNVIWNLNPIIKKYNLYDDIDGWIKTSLDKYDSVSDVSGENNPMYNRKHTEKTKKIISDLAKERTSDVKYREKMSKVQKDFWGTERGLDLKKIISDRIKKKYDLKNPIIKYNCHECGTEFNKRTNDNKNFCSTKCERGWKYSNIDGYGKHTNKLGGYRKNILTYIDKIIDYYNISQEEFFNNLTNMVNKAKQDGVIPKNKGISVETLKKYNIK